MAYIGNQMPHRKKKPKSTIKSVVVGCKTAIDDIRNILEREYPESIHHFIEGNSATAPNGHLAIDDTYDIVIYDTTSYEYGTILELLEKTPGNKAKLATYSPDTGVLITEGHIYHKKQQ